LEKLGDENCGKIVSIDISGTNMFSAFPDPDASLPLVSLPSNAFVSMVFLKNLSINYSDLASISENTFASLSSIQKLDLSNNQIATLSENTFASLKSLDELDLSSN
jgi:Leucine-rich repeat (LRR) protein